MTILEPGPVVVAPAPAPTPSPPRIVGPAPEPELRVIRRRRRAPMVVAAAAVLAIVAGVVVVSSWPGQSPAGPPAPTPPPTYARLSGVTATSVAFQWSAPLTDASVVGYEILRNGVVGDFLMPVQTSYDATGLATGRTYRFQVVAVYADSASTPSAPIVATTR